MNKLLNTDFIYSALFILMFISGQMLGPQAQPFFRCFLVMTLAAYLLLVRKNQWKMKFANHPIQVAFIFIFCWYILGTILSFQSRGIDFSIHMIARIGIGLLIFLLCSEATLWKKPLVPTLWIGWALANFLLNKIELIYNFQLSSLYMQQPERIRPSALFSNENEFAFFLGVTIPLCIYVAISSETRIIVKIISGTIALAFLLHMIGPLGSRSSSLLPILYLVIFGFYFLRLHIPLQTFQIGLVLTSVFAFLGMTLPEKIFNVFINPSFNSIDSMQRDYSRLSTSMGSRISTLKNSYYYLQDSLFMGTGFGSEDHLVSWSSLYPSPQAHALHNTVLQVLTTTGIFGGVLIFGGLTYFLAWSHQQIVRTRDYKDKIRILTGLCMVITLFVLSISSANIFILRQFWVSLAMGFALAQNVRTERIPDEA